MHAVALIGAGRIGQIHAANIAANPRLRLACVIDPRTEAAGTVATRYGATVGEFADALADREIAGIVVASSTDSHLRFTMAAAEAGKPVFCEKPFDQDLASAESASARLHAIGARVLLGFNRRFDPDFAALRRHLVDDAGGPVEALHITSHDPAPPSLEYLATSGGLFKDMVIHDFDMARWLLDEDPVGVFASASCLVDPAIAGIGDVDTARTILRTASGRLCTISSSRRSGYGYDQRIEAFGARGMIQARNRTMTILERWSDDGATSAPFQHFFLDRYADAYVREMAHFADVIAGAAPAVTHHDGVAALRLAEAAGRSVRSGRMEQV